MKTSIPVRIAASMVLGVLAGFSPATAAPGEPFLFSYMFNNRLKIAGGYYTMNGSVQVIVKRNNGTTVFVRNVTAKPHSVTPGGAIYVETTIYAPCPQPNNGYAQAYDRATRRWSPRLAVAICVLRD